MAIYKSDKPTKDGRQYYFMLYKKDFNGINKKYKSKKYKTKPEARDAEALFLLKRDNPLKKSFCIVAKDVFDTDKNGNVILDKDGNPKIVENGLRKRGPEKNHRTDPIVEMGLLMNASGIPISYDLFPGNKSEKNSLIPILNRTKKDCEIGRTIVVADRGLNTSDNIIQIVGLSLEQSLKKNGYVYGQSVRAADEEFKSWVLNQDGYVTDVITEENGNEIVFKHKSRVYPKKMYVIREDKGKTASGNQKRDSILVDQKQMVYYSQKYADKQKMDRQVVIDKARDLVAHPDKYTRSTSYGATYTGN